MEYVIIVIVLCGIATLLYYKFKPHKKPETVKMEDEYEKYKLVKYYCQYCGTESLPKEGKDVRYNKLTGELESKTLIWRCTNCHQNIQEISFENNNGVWEADKKYYWDD